MNAFMLVISWAEAAPLKYYLDLREDYIGSHVVGLYGVWAAYAGDRALSARLMEDGYVRFCAGRFEQTFEYRSDVFPEQPLGLFSPTWVDF